MKTEELVSLVEDLDDNIEDLEENLAPLLNAALSASTKRLPMLDRAKLHVLVVYSIESLLFSYLRLHGVQAKEHAVFKELTRVKQYFEKIKQAEAGPVKARENMSLNKEATKRVLEAALTGNEKHDAERKERELRERILAARKLKSLEKNMQEKASATEPSVDIPAPSENDEDDKVDEEMEEGEIDSDTVVASNPVVTDEPVSAEQPSNAGKKRKRKGKQNPLENGGVEDRSKTGRKRPNRQAKKTRKRQRLESQQGQQPPG